MAPFTQYHILQCALSGDHGAHSLVMANSNEDLNNFCFHKTFELLVDSRIRASSDPEWAKHVQLPEIRGSYVIASSF